MMRSLNYQWWYMEYDANYFKNGLDYLTFQGQLYFNYRFDFQKKSPRVKRPYIPRKFKH